MATFFGQVTLLDIYLSQTLRKHLIFLLILEITVKQGLEATQQLNCNISFVLFAFKYFITLLVQV